MNLLILISLFVGLAKGIQNLHDKILVVERRVKENLGSGVESKYDSGPIKEYSFKMNRKSHSSYGSGIESKYSSKMGSYNHGSLRRGSTIIHDSGAKYGSYNRGSTSIHGSSAKRGSSNQSSNTARGSKHSSGSGSLFYSSKYIWHSSGATGSNPIHGSSKTHSYGAKSGAKGGSGSNKNIPYDIFAPTHSPTYWLPPIYSPPPPSHYPTNFQEIPTVPINFNQPIISGIEVPQIPLSFQIQQGANGWSKYPDSPSVSVVIKVAAKTVGLPESVVTNMKITKKNRRALATTVTITYDITTTPEIVGEKTQKAAYDILIYKLQIAVKNNNFSSELHKLGVQLNISSISFSEYVVYYPTMTPTVQQNVLLSGGIKNDIPVTESVLIGVGVLLALGIMVSFGFLWYKTKRENYTQKKVELIPEVYRPDSLARIINPMIDDIPRQTIRISFDHTYE
jgi:flagellar basal body-associated protein FliL